jgi:nitrous oxide reductase accessory protein NosL
MRFPAIHNSFHKRASLCLLIALFFVVAPSLAQVGEREGCVICGMYLDMYAKTRWMIILDDGSSQSTCGMACAVKVIDAHKGRVKDVKVADFSSGALIAAQKAFFLEGSDIPGVMSYTSRIAFSSKEAVQEFKKKHGGRIVLFEEALRNQLKERE